MTLRLGLQRQVAEKTPIAFGRPRFERAIHLQPLDDHARARPNFAGFIFDFAAHLVTMRQRPAHHIHPLSCLQNQLRFHRACLIGRQVTPRQIFAIRQLWRVK